MRLAGHVASVGEKKMHTRLQWEYVKEIDHLEELCLNGRIICVTYILIKQ